MDNVWNKFRSYIQTLNKDEKQELLQELQADLMYAKSRRFIDPNVMSIKLLHKKIRCLKTSIER